jgi:2-dehydropantoate 2-reductase
MTGQTLGKMLAGINARRFFIRIVSEDMRVAEAMGIKVPPFGGKLDYYSFIKGNFLLAELKRHIILFAVGLRYRKLRSSSLTSLMRAGKTEVDYLNGWIAQKGRGTWPAYACQRPRSSVLLKRLNREKGI